MKEQIYQRLVNRNPGIQKRYQKIRQTKTGVGGRAYAWTALIGMNIAAKFGKKFYMDPPQKLPVDQSESALTQRETPAEFAAKLAKYDVISFDVFDTLIFRPFGEPTDLFFFVGERLGYLDFENIRKNMEWRARQLAHENRDTYEIALDDIWNEIEEQVGIPKAVGMPIEIELELEYCFGNPYMLQVVKHLKQKGKTVICTSDMYLPKDVIRQMVEKSGYKGIDRFFVSCEDGGSKSEGSLYEIVKKTFGENLKYVHTGDHYAADVEKAKKAGFDANHYPNVNATGNYYRSYEMSIITGSMYRGILNTHLRNGLYKFSQEYEVGYNYGGLFVLGYCQWIHDYVHRNNIDKILFLARDGDILSRAYAKMYPEEADSDHIQYVYWSRLAATKMGAKYFKFDYFRRFIDHKVGQKYTLKKILGSMELDDMLPDLCKYLPNFMEEMMNSKKLFGINESVKTNIRKEAQVTEDTELTQQNGWLIREYLIAHWDEVLAHYTEQNEAGRQYYAKAVEGCKKVVAVDIGWAGSGAVVLSHLVEKEWNLDCEIIGLIAGTNSLCNFEPNMSEPLFYSGKLVSYMYSQEHNRDIWYRHNPGLGHNLVWEMLLESAQPTFKKFGLKDGQVTFEFGRKDGNPKGIEDIQKGILDFIDDAYERHLADRNISGSDVYCAVVMTKDYNAEYSKKINESFEQATNVE